MFLLLLLFDENKEQIVDVGAGGAGAQEGAHRIQQRIGVVVAQSSGWRLLVQQAGQTSGQVLAMIPRS